VEGGGAKFQVFLDVLSEKVNVHLYLYISELNILSFKVPVLKYPFLTYSVMIDPASWLEAVKYLYKTLSSRSSNYEDAF